MTSMITNNEEDIFLAVENSEVIGFIHVKEEFTLPYDSIIPHHYALIAELMVTSGHRKEGIGSKLMDTAKQWAVERNLDYLQLLVLAEAENQYQFYKNRDFITVFRTMRHKL